MAAWNAAAKRATVITKSAATHQTTRPAYEDGPDAVKKATEEFMAAYNAAVRRATVVEQAVSTLPVQVGETDAVKAATAEFMSAWHAAAERAPSISQTAYSSALPDNSAVEKATAEFMAAWNEAAARVPKIETTMYALSGSSTMGTCAACATPTPVVETSEVQAAREAFMVQFRAAEAAAQTASVSHGVLPVPSALTMYAPRHAVTYSAAVPVHGYALSDRLFAPFSTLPLHVKDC